MIRSAFGWLKDRLSHKLHHLSKKKIAEVMKREGLALVVIIVGWEIIEDIIFPVLFGLLGKHVHNVFYAAIPVSWLLCLHWLAVPVLLGLWSKFRGRHQEIAEKCDHH